MTFEEVMENIPYNGFLKLNYLPTTLYILFVSIFVLMLLAVLLSYRYVYVLKDTIFTKVDMYFYLTVLILLVVSYIAILPIQEDNYIKRWETDYLHPYLLTLEPTETTYTFKEDFLLEDVDSVRGTIIFFNDGLTEKEEGYVTFNNTIQEPRLTRYVLDKDIKTNIDGLYKEKGTSIYAIELPISYYGKVQRKTLSFYR